MTLAQHKVTELASTGYLKTLPLFIIIQYIVYFLSQGPWDSAVVSIGQIHGCFPEARFSYLLSLSITLEDFVLPDPISLGLSVLEISVP